MGHPTVGQGCPGELSPNRDQGLCMGLVLFLWLEITAAFSLGSLPTLILHLHIPQELPALPGVRPGAGAGLEVLENSTIH